MCLVHLHENMFSACFWTQTACTPMQMSKKCCQDVFKSAQCSQISFCHGNFLFVKDLAWLFLLVMETTASSGPGTEDATKPVPTESEDFPPPFESQIQVFPNTQRLFEFHFSTYLQLQLAKVIASLKLPRCLCQMEERLH